MPKLLKDKRIKLISLDWDETYTDQIETILGEVWAHYRSMSVRETFQAGADYSWNNAYFTFTKPSFNLDTYDVIEYAGKRWDIEGIDLFEDKDGANIRVQARAKYGV